MSWKIKISIISGLLLVLFANVAFAQGEPRPTPTNVPTPTVVAPTPTRNPNASPEDNSRGTIQGVVYQDVNGDGRCVGTGIPGEGPVPNVDIEFVSSDEKTVITLYSGPDGIYGLFAAGHSYWAVTAKPGPEWIVTSQQTLYAPIFEDSRVQTDINFCVMKTTGYARVRAILPEAGRAASPGLTITALAGLTLVLTGLFLNWREKRQRI